MADDRKRGYLGPRVVEGYDPAIDTMSDRIHELEAEIERLQRWKAEATAVIEDWEAVWEAAGSPGSLGDYKPLALAVELGRLDDEIEQFRQLGDTLAYWVRFGDGKEMHSAVHRWEQARRG